MSEPHNASALGVKLAKPKMNVLGLTQLAAKQKTDGNPRFNGIPCKDNLMFELGKKLSIEYTNFKSKPPTSTKALVNSRIIAFCIAYNKNAAFIQGIARDIVIATGDINQGINLVEISGYLLKDTKGSTSKGFKLTPDGPGAVKISTKAIARNATYIRQYGLATAIDIEPVKEALRPLLISHENDIRLCNLKRAGIYAVCEASILPISRKPDSGTPATDVEKTATPSMATKAHKRIFMDDAISHYNFGPWHWVVVQ